MFRRLSKFENEQLEKAMEDYRTGFDDSPRIELRLAVSTKEELENCLEMVNEWSSRYPNLTKRLRININGYVQ